MVPPALVHHHAIFHLLHSLRGNFVSHSPFPSVAAAVAAVVDAISFLTWKTVAMMVDLIEGMRPNARYLLAA